MVLYTCPRCGFSNNIKTKIKNHYNRKIPCKAILKNVSIKNCLIDLDKKTNKDYKNILNNDNKILNSNKNYTCEICMKIFNRKYNYDRHLLSCKSLNVINDRKEIDKDLIIKTKDIIIENLKSQIDVLLKNQGSNNIHNNITYNTQIILNPFGKEDTSYITGNFVRKLIDNGAVDSIIKLLEHIHFNPDHIENHNIKIPNKKKPWAEIYNGVNWELKDKNQTIVKMTDNAYSILNTHYLGGNSYMNNVCKLYDIKDETLHKRLNKDTEIMILNLGKK